MFEVTYVIAYRFQPLWPDCISPSGTWIDFPLYKHNTYLCRNGKVMTAATVVVCPGRLVNYRRVTTTLRFWALCARRGATSFYPHSSLPALQFVSNMMNDEEEDPRDVDLKQLVHLRTKNALWVEIYWGQVGRRWVVLGVGGVHAAGGKNAWSSSWISLGSRGWAIRCVCLWFSSFSSRRTTTDRQ